MLIRPDRGGSSPLPGEACVALPPGLDLRSPSAADAEALAVLMLAAFRGAIVEDGETLADARAEVQGYLAGQAGEPLLEASWIGWEQDLVVSACLVSWWREAPLIAYLMTRGERKRQGLGRRTLVRSLAALHTKGHPLVRAIITTGNQPSEALFRHAGFVEDPEGPSSPS